MKKTRIFAIILVIIVLYNGCTPANRAETISEHDVGVVDTNISEAITSNGTGEILRNTTAVYNEGLSEKALYPELDIQEDEGNGKVAYYLSPSVYRHNIPQIEEFIRREPNRFIYNLFPVNSDYDLNLDVLDEFVNKGIEIIENPDVKTFFMYYTPLAIDLFEKIKESRPDILIIVVGRINDKFTNDIDITLAFDELGMIKKEVVQAKNMGVETFFYISNSSVPLNSENDDLENLKETILKEESKSLGIKYIRIPPIQDSMGPEGDISHLIKTHGKNISIFAPTHNYPEWLIRLPIKYDYIFIQQDDTYPVYSDLAYYLRIENNILTNYLNDYTQLRNQLKEKLTEHAQPGRYAILSAPFNVVSITAAIEYGLEYGNGNTSSKVDIEVLRKSFDKALAIHGFADAGYELNQDTECDNRFLFTTDYIVY